MLKRSILIVCNRSLNLGGIEAAFIKLVNALSSDSDNSVTVLLKDDKGELFNCLPKNISIAYIPHAKSKLFLKDDFKHFRIIRILKSVYYRFRMRLAKHYYKQTIYSYRIMKPHISIHGKFDCAIAYSVDYFDMAIVAISINADRKFVFIHTNPSLDLQCEKIKDSILPKFDGICCVSRGLLDIFSKVHPASKDRAFVLYNLIDVNEVKSKANDNISQFCKNHFNISTVGRISPEKGFDRVPEVTRKLIDSGYDINWYIVGDGVQRDEIEKLIIENGVQNNVFMLGMKENPYPYIKQCDIYVQPSYTEGYCTTTMEAKILHKPVVTTDVPGMREQFESGINGLIVESSVEGLYSGIKKLIDEPELRESFVEHLKGEKLDNTEELQKLYKFIES